jgi:hypothetical protein
MANPPNQFTEAEENAPNLDPFPSSACDSNIAIGYSGRITA